MIKGLTHAHLGPIWYYSELSDVPYTPNQFLGWDFFAASYSKTALRAYCPNIYIYCAFELLPVKKRPLLTSMNFVPSLLFRSLMLTCCK